MNSTQSTTLRDALQRIADSIPACDNGMFFTEHFTPDGEQMGVQQHDPVEVIGYIDALARAALAAADATDQGQDDAPFDEDKLLHLFCTWECLTRGPKGKAAWEAIIAHVKEYAARPAPIGAVAPDAVERIPNFTPGTVYRSRTYGPLVFVRMDTFYGETSYQFKEGRGDRYLLPAVLAHEFAARHEPSPQPAPEAASDDGVAVPRASLSLIYDAMNYMGDVLNRMDAVELDDEAATVPAFDAIRALLAAPAAPIAEVTACHCEACEPNQPFNSRMILCATCGNKRCPHATDHRNACTNSNEPGQPGSAYADQAPTPSPLLDTIERERVAGATVLQGIDLDVIARAYDWTIDQHGELLGVTSGDMGYEPTGIKITGDTLDIWNDGVSKIERGQQSIAVDGAPSTNSAAERLLKAAKTYFDHYVQDEADPGYGPDDLVCSVEQHEHAKELAAAIATMQQSATP